MPLLGWVASPFPWVAGGQTWSEHFSEALGHVVWLWSIEIVRRDLRNRITHQPDPEVPFPPRTPARNATNPPQTMLEWFGMSPEQSHTTVSFNLNDNLPIYSFIIHFSFAIVFALLYCIAAEYFPKIKLWQGAAFGLLVWIGAHVVFMPLLGWVPSPFPWVAGGQTWSEHFSEALGHVVWLWSIEIVRRDLRNRITHQPDPEVPLDQPYR